jgi:hypothetical protein
LDVVSRFAMSDKIVVKRDADDWGVSHGFVGLAAKVDLLADARKPSSRHSTYLQA